MHHAEGGSWAVYEDLGEQLTDALYFRDALGIATEQAVDVPRLEPVVPPRSDLVEHLADQTISEWNSWFGGLLTSTESPDQDSRALLVDAASSAGFRMLLGEIIDAATAWRNHRKWEHIEEFRRQTTRQRLLLNELASSLERSMARKASPFQLRITILPVRGKWAHRPSADRLLVSRMVSYDAAATRDVLEPVIRELI